MMRRVIPIKVCVLLALCIACFSSACSADNGEVAAQGGNWVKKRTWVKFGQVLCDQIDADVVAIEKGRTHLTELFGAIDTKVDAFYLDKGAARGQFGDVVSDLYADIAAYEKDRLAEVTHAAEGEDVPLNYFVFEKEALEKEVNQLKVQVEQFSLDIAEITHLDTSLKERLVLADKAIKNAREQAARAKEIGKKLWDVLDDQAARDMYYELKESIAVHVSDMKTYVLQTLPANIATIGSAIDEQMRMTAALILSLEEQGLAIRNRQARTVAAVKADRSSAKRLASGVSEVASDKGETADAPSQRHARSPQVAQPWYTRALAGFVAVGEACADGIVSLFDAVTALFS